MLPIPRIFAQGTCGWTRVRSSGTCRRASEMTATQRSIARGKRDQQSRPPVWPCGQPRAQWRFGCGHPRASTRRIARAFPSENPDGVPLDLLSNPRGKTVGGPKIDLSTHSVLEETAGGHEAAEAVALLRTEGHQNVHVAGLGRLTPRVRSEQVKLADPEGAEVAFGRLQLRDDLFACDAVTLARAGSSPNHSAACALASQSSSLPGFISP